MERPFGVFVALLFLNPLLSYCEGKSCSNGHVTVIEGDCNKIYQESGADRYFNIDGECGLMSALNFTLVKQNWSSHFNTCKGSGGLYLSQLQQSGGSDALLSTQCVQFNTSVSSSNCSCQMNCLLHFHPTSYAYLEGIDCDTQLYNTTIDGIYKKSPGYWSNFTIRNGSTHCNKDETDQSVTSTIISSTTITSESDTLSLISSFISSSSSSFVIVPSSPLSLDITPTSFLSPSPSNVPVMCPTTENNDNICKNCNNCYCSTVVSYAAATAISSQCYLTGPGVTLPTVIDSIQHCNATSPNNNNSEEDGFTLKNINCFYETCNDSLSSSPSSSLCLSYCLVSVAPSTCIKFSKSEWQSLYQCTTNNSQSISITKCTGGVTSTVVSTASQSSLSTRSASVFPTVDGSDNLPVYRQVYFVASVGLFIVLLILLIILFAVCLAARSVRRRRLFKQYNTSPAAVSDIVSTSGIYSSQRSELTATATCIPSPSTPTSTTTVLQVYGKPVVDYDKWKQIFTRYIIRHAQITIMDNIGEGAFGLVQKGSMLKASGEKVDVAIKAMKDASTAEQVEEFMSESAIMLDFDHPNVLKLLGVCFDTEDNLPVIVLPLMANGDLKSYLQTKRKLHSNIDISVPLLIRICLDICQGMEYLVQKKFVHRDLAARNCMVDKDLHVCVADFGLSRDIYSRDYYRLERRVKLPVKWLPPESLHDNMYNEKTDVWSFGVTCWEVFSLGKTPYPAIDNPDVLDYIEKGMRLTKPKLAPKEIYLLLSQCWDENPDKRPLFSDLVKMMNSIHTNWKEHTSALQRKMEEELLSCTQEELAMINSAGDISASQASFARRVLRNSRTSTSSIAKEPAGYLLPSSIQAGILDSSDEYNHLSHFKSAVVQPKSPHGLPPGQYSFMSSQEGYSDEGIPPNGVSIHRPPSLENFGRTLDRREDDSSPSLPVFEQLYDDPKELDERSTHFESSEERGRPHPSSLPKGNRKHQKRAKARHSSKSSTAPLLCSTSSSTNMNVDSPLESHYYFTLEKPVEALSVFGEDTDNSDNEKNQVNSILKNSSGEESSKSPSPAMGQEVGVVGGMVSPGYKDTSFYKSKTVDVPTHLMSGRGMISNSTSLVNNQVPLQQF